MHTFEWAVSGFGTLVTAIVANFQQRLSQHSKRLNAHDVELGKICPELKVTFLEALKDHEVREEVKFDKIHKSIDDLKEIVLTRRTD